MFKKPVFNPEKEIPDLSGRVILVTGGTGGLGRETVLSFAQHNPAHIFFTGRSQPSAEQTMQLATQKAPQTPVTFIKCDLASFSSVKQAAQDILSKTDRLDILNANAGIMASPSGMTTDGYEIQFGTNHIGHALLVKLLTPLLQKTAQTGADVRVVWDTSLGYKASTGIDFSKLKTKQEDISYFLAPWFRYGQSKLANLLYARAYAKKYPEITSVSIHPGVSATGLVENLSFFHKVFVYSTSYFLMIPPEQCAWNQQWAAVAPLGKGPRQVETGTWYEPVGLKGSLTKAGADDELAEVLWRWTEKELQGWEL
ncbi:uncharacterized protein MYCFIDRAFT_134134 [Pseudocercospora fijiensis CIRAD86]|uniref:Oxidoreductase n=1 Tax=Pseudocercospora fijiensis (strain CIRAD86) TaxID=383855 RepID=M3B547_PSEFD|nr:uncharacterized protein MYCFIDRAFT_134134 [Pseudocercospora fijiensis CIRAD86]EME84493.1 hypothetical protein MYCFIDRAFT_134134 [Pseudocercospora fijiensis CIRAD86]